MMRRLFHVSGNSLRKGLGNGACPLLPGAFSRRSNLWLSRLDVLRLRGSYAVLALLLAALQHHTRMQLGNGRAAGLYESKRQHSMDEASEACFEHCPTKASGHEKVLAIGFADTRWVLGKSAVDGGDE